MNEIWVPAFEWEEAYEVSNMGNVRSLPRGVARPTQWNKLRPIKPFYSRGYARVTLIHNGREKRKQLHRLVLESFTGQSPKDLVAAHWDGNQKNNHLSNLRWATVSENHLDKRRHGTDKLGGRKKPNLINKIAN